MACCMNCLYGMAKTYLPNLILIEISQYEAGLTNFTFEGSRIAVLAALLN